MTEKVIYEGPIFTLVKEDVTIKNKVYQRDIIHHPGGVGILCMINHKILLVKQVRQAIDLETIEIPAGKLEYGEDPLECGMRELNEETGYACSSMRLIQSFYTTPGFCDENCGSMKPSIQSRPRNICPKTKMKISIPFGCLSRKRTRKF